MLWLDDSSAAKAAALAAAHALPLVEACGLAAKSERERLRFLQDQLVRLPALVFWVKEDVLQLAWIDEREVLAISAGFHGSAVNYRRAKGGGRSEMIARSVGIKGAKLPNVIDATAGLGVDAFVLASLGCRVTLLERVPAVSALLQDGLDRSACYAGTGDSQLAEILQRMQLVRMDAIEYFRQLAARGAPEVVYLDPMFPQRQKSAAVKKEMQLFHRLIGADVDADRLFEAALASGAGRVVVKRPRRAKPLADCAPSYCMEGKRNRYDIYMNLPL